MLRFVSSITLLLSLAGGACAAPAVLTDASSGSSLNEQIELLEDVGARLGIADLADPAVQQRFRPADGRASVGQSRHPWWVKVQLARSADAPRH